MQRALFLTAVLALFGCSSAAQQVTGGEAAARVGDRVISTKELDDRWRALDPSGHAEAAQKAYEGKRSALDAIVAEMLIAQAAKAKNMTAEAYEEAELKTRTKPIGESDVVTFYQANINQMQGRSLELMAPARLGITDGGLTFASNGDRGVLLAFRERVPAIDPLGLIRHPELTVTVADVHGLLSALGADR